MIKAGEDRKKIVLVFNKKDNEAYFPDEIKEYIAAIQSVGFYERGEMLAAKLAEISEVVSNNIYINSKLAKEYEGKIIREKSNFKTFYTWNPNINDMVIYQVENFNENCIIKTDYNGNEYVAFI